MKITLILLLILTLGTSCTSSKQEDQKSVVVSVLDANIPHIDPIHATNKYSSTIVGSIFEGLYHYNYIKRPIEVEPALAEAMPKISADGTTYTIALKKGVLFQDDPAFADGKGRELTTKDVIYSWKRLADPKNKALGWFMMDGLIKGLNKWRDDIRSGQANYDTEVEGLRAIDDHTLQIHLTRRSFQFTHVLATTITTIVAREVVEKYGKDIINHPVGTGPFVLKNWARNSKVVLLRNPTYREVIFNGEKLPLSDKVIVRVITERQPLWLTFLKGELDHGIIPKDNYDQVVKNEKVVPEYAAKGINILYLPRPDVTYITFNMEHPILGKNKKLRQALAMALNKEMILEKFYNRRGLVAQSPIPPGLDGYRENYRNPIQFDLEKAKTLLAEAGYPEGKGLPVFDYDLPSTITWSRQYGELIKDLWSRIGVKIKLHPNTWPQFDKKIKTKKATIFDMAWNADYPDAENFLQLFYSKNISPGSNNFNYVNRAYDDLFEKFVNLPPSPKRNELIYQMIDILGEDVPGTFIIHRIFRLPYYQWLENFNKYPIIYDHLRYLRVNKAKKQELIKKN